MMTLTSGVARGASLSPGELRTMIRGYYDAREWTECGFVPGEKAAGLGVAEVTRASSPR